MIRINWGGAIVIAFILFMGFIMYFVLLSNLDKKYDYHMVEDNYYKREMEYQHKVDEQVKTQNEKMEVRVENTSSDIVLSFPKKIDDTSVKGTVRFYRPSDKEKDFVLPIQLSEHQMSVSRNRLDSGRWNIEVYYQYKGNAYRTIEHIKL